MKKFLLFVFAVAGVFLFSSTDVLAISFRDPACDSTSNYCKCNFYESAFLGSELVTTVSCSPEWTFWTSSDPTVNLSYFVVFNAQQKICNINDTDEAIFENITGEQCIIGSFVKADACDCSVSDGESANLGVISKDASISQTEIGLFAGNYFDMRVQQIGTAIQTYLKNTGFCPIGSLDIKPFLNKSTEFPDYLAGQGDLVHKIDDWNLVCSPVTNPRNVCCCVTTFEGTTNAKRLCEQQVLQPTADAKCGPVNKVVVSPDAGKLPEPVVFDIPASGNCTELEDINKNYQGAATKIEYGIDQLKIEAKTLNPFGFTTGRAGVLDLFGKVIKFWTFAIGSLLLLSYVWAGFLWITSAGSSEKIGTAKKIFVWSTLGVVITLASYMIVNMVFGFLG